MRAMSSSLMRPIQLWDAAHTNTDLRIAFDSFQKISVSHLHRECSMLQEADSFSLMYMQYLAGALRPEHSTHFIMASYHSVLAFAAPIYLQDNQNIPMQVLVVGSTRL